MMMEEHFEDKELISQTIHSRPNRLKASLAVAQIWQRRCWWLRFEPPCKRKSVLRCTCCEGGCEIKRIDFSSHQWLYWTDVLNLHLHHPHPPSMVIMIKVIMTMLIIIILTMRCWWSDTFCWAPTNCSTRCQKPPSFQISKDCKGTIFSINFTNYPDQNSFHWHHLEGLGRRADADLTKVLQGQKLVVIRWRRRRWHWLLQISAFHLPAGRLINIHPEMSHLNLSS